jgi:hypothetical protein
MYNCVEKAHSLNNKIASVSIATLEEHDTQCIFLFWVGGWVGVLYM